MTILPSTAAQLLASCQECDLDGIRQALSTGLDPNVVSGSSGEGPLHAIVDAWVDHQWEDITANPDRVPPPYTAAIDAINDLIAAGARVNHADQEHRTALHRAADTHPRLVQALLDAGADLTARDSEGNTPFLLAARGDSAVVRACVCVLISAGAEIHAVNNEADNALMFNAAWGYWQMLALLLDSGLEVNARDSSGRTPLYWAAEAGYIKAIEVLLEHGADPNCAVASRTALMAAAHHGSAAAVSRLLAAGADPDARDDQGRTARVLAQQMVGVDLAETLVAALKAEPWTPADAEIVVKYEFNEAGEPLIEVSYRAADGTGGAGYRPRCDRFEEVITLLR